MGYYGNGSGPLAPEKPYAPPKPPPPTKPKSSGSAQRTGNGQSATNTRVYNSSGDAHRKYGPPSSASDPRYYPAPRNPVTEAAARIGKRTGSTAPPSSGGNGGGTGAGGAATTPGPAGPAVTAPAPAPAAADTTVPTTMDITVPDASQDAVYQQQIAQFAQQLTDYQAAQDLATQQYNAQYDTNLNRLGWNDKTGWDQAQNGVTSYAKDFNNDTGDFAGRGAYWSGAYANSIGDLTNQYNQQKSDLATGKQNYGDTQLQALTGYQDANTQSQQAALSDATARIAAKYGIDAAQVPVSGGAKKMTVPVNTASGA